MPDLLVRNWFSVLTGVVAVAAAWGVNTATTRSLDLRLTKIENAQVELLRFQIDSHHRQIVALQADQRQLQGQVADLKTTVVQTFSIVERIEARLNRSPGN